MNGFKAIVAVQGSIGQTLTHLLLLGRVNLGVFIRIYQVVDTHQTAVGNNLGSFPLLLAQQGSADTIHITVIVCPGGNLYEVEGNLAESELLPPLLHEQFHAL